MSEDFYRSEGGRDGYRSQRDNNGNGGRQYGHTPRPRITRNARPEGSNTYEVREQQGGYRPRFGGDNGYRSNGGLWQDKPKSKRRRLEVKPILPKRKNSDL